MVVGRGGGGSKSNDSKKNMVFFAYSYSIYFPPPPLLAGQTGVRWGGGWEGDISTQRGVAQRQCRTRNYNSGPFQATRGLTNGMFCSSLPPVGGTVRVFWYANKTRFRSFSLDKILRASTGN